MTKRQARTLAARIEREDPSCSAKVTGDGCVQMTDHRTGYTAIIRYPEQWDIRKADADEAENA